MSIIELLKKTIKLLEQEECQYALAGGIVASVYRSEKRFTEDIDLLLLSSSTKKTAKLIQGELGFGTSFIKLHQLKKIPMMNKKSQPDLIAVGRSKDVSLGVDFILPDMPWFTNAMSRAQANKLDFGFGIIPCMTVEDVIISKVFATRFKDIDDIIAILEADHPIDYTYLYSELTALKLSFPVEALKYLPSDKRKVFKKI